MVYVEYLPCCIQAIASLFHKGTPVVGYRNVLPPAGLPESMELSKELALALLRDTNGDQYHCHVASVAGPVVAMLLGAADGLALSPREMSHVRVVLRRELRSLASVVSKGAVEVGKMPSLDQDRKVGGKQVGRQSADSFRTLVEWCSMPAVPSYGIGVHLVLGDADDAMCELAKNFAWVLRLMGSRARLNLHKEVPLLAAFCKTLCETNNNFATSITDVLALGKSLQRRVSFSEYSTPSCESERLEFDGPWFRHNSDENPCVRTSSDPGDTSRMGLPQS